MIYGTVGLGKICFTVLDAEEETFREGGFLSPVERDIKRHAEVCQLEHVLQGSQEERQDSLARQQHPALHPVHHVQVSEKVQNRKVLNIKN